MKASRKAKKILTSNNNNTIKGLSGSETVQIVLTTMDVVQHWQRVTNTSELHTTKPERDTCIFVNYMGWGGITNWCIKCS
jgi:hypothetical protein